MTDTRNSDVPASIDPSNDPVWRRLQSYQFDDPDAELTFTERLARENGWKPDYAARVVEEYKRFCYLAIRAGHDVTPSDAVDQAWHLHLTYSSEYWDRFCPEVLGEPLHHGPTKGGGDEALRYWEQYEKTLEAYENLSGEPPPADIWPSPQERFVDVSAMRRVNTANHWVIPKLSLNHLHTVKWLCLVAGILFVIIGKPVIAVVAAAAWLMTAALVMRERKLSSSRAQQDGVFALVAAGLIIHEVAGSDSAFGGGPDAGGGGDGGGGCGGCGGGA